MAPLLLLEIIIKLKMKRSSKTTGDGSPIIEGNSNVVTNTFINRHGKAFKIFVGIAFISCFIIIYKFANIGVYNSFKETVCIADSTPSGNIMNFIHYVVSNDNDIVYFDTVITTDNTKGVEYNGPCKNNLRFAYDKESESGSGHMDGRYFFDDETSEIDVVQVSDVGQSYYFNFTGLVDNALIEKIDYDNNNPLDYEDNFISLLLDFHKIAPTNNKKVFNDLSHLSTKRGSGYNIHIKLESNSRSRYTHIREGQEGYEPFLKGLVQINSDWDGELTTYTLSAPDPANVDNKKFQCTKLEKPKIVKFFICPFL